MEVEASRSQVVSGLVGCSGAGGPVINNMGDGHEVPARAAASRPASAH